MKVHGHSLTGNPDESIIQTRWIFQALITLYFGVAGLCPKAAKSWVAFMVGMAHYMAVGKQRLIVAESLSTALGLAPDSAPIKKYTRHVFVYFGNYLIDLARLRRKEPTRRVSQYRVKIHGEENLTGALESGRPLVFSGLHFGNWDVGLELLTSLLSNRPMVSVVSPIRYMALRNRIASLNSANYREVVAGGRGVALALRTLKDGGVVVTMLDGPGDEVPRLPTRFLNGTAMLSLLPLRLAQKSNALVVPTALAYVSRFEFAAYVGTPVEVSSPDDKEALSSSMRAIATQIESWVRQYPAQWYCFHRLWEPDSNAQNRSEPRTMSRVA